MNLNARITKLEKAAATTTAPAGVLQGISAQERGTRLAAFYDLARQRKADGWTPDPNIKPLTDAQAKRLVGLLGGTWRHE